MLLPLLSQAVLVFDVSDRASFESLGEWLTEARDFGAKKLQTVVCGNKVRPLMCSRLRLRMLEAAAQREHRTRSALLLLSQTDKKREVSESEALAWAADHRLEYVIDVCRHCDAGSTARWSGGRGFGRSRPLCLRGQ